MDNSQTTMNGETANPQGVAVLGRLEMEMTMGAATEQDRALILPKNQMMVDGVVMDHGAILAPAVDGADMAEVVLPMMTLMIGDTGMNLTMKMTLAQAETPFISKITGLT